MKKHDHLLHNKLIFLIYNYNNIINLFLFIKYLSTLYISHRLLNFFTIQTFVHHRIFFFSQFIHCPVSHVPH